MRKPVKQIAVFLGAAAACGALIAPASAAGAAFTWTGQHPTDGAWSQGANWQGGTAPAGSVDLLEFPNLITSECTAFPFQGACYEAANDLVGLSVSELRINAPTSPGFYDLTGNGITLGSGRISAGQGGDGGASRNGDIRMPLALGSDQTWRLDGSIIGVSGGADGKLRVECRASEQPASTGGVERGRPRDVEGDWRLRRSCGWRASARR